MPREIRLFGIRVPMYSYGDTKVDYYDFCVVIKNWRIGLEYSHSIKWSDGSFQIDAFKSSIKIG